MLFYYQSWMFYTHYIVILYHFLVLTSWHSAKCQLLFLHVFYITGNKYQKKSKCHANLRWFFMGQKEHNGPWLHLEGVPRRGQPTRARQEAQARPWWVVPTPGAPWTDSLLYKYPNIPKTLGESTEFSSSRRRVQNHEIQSRHHHGGVHYIHWCLSDDAWVVLCRPPGP